MAPPALDLCDTTVESLNGLRTTAALETARTVESLSGVRTVEGICG